MPYDTYRLYQAERGMSDAGIRRADERAGQFASAMSSLLRGITRRGPAVRASRPAAAPRVPVRPDWPADLLAR